MCYLGGETCLRCYHVQQKVREEEIDKRRPVHQQGCCHDDIRLWLFQQGRSEVSEHTQVQYLKWALWKSLQSNIWVLKGSLKVQTGFLLFVIAQLFLSLCHQGHRRAGVYPSKLQARRELCETQRSIFLLLLYIWIIKGVWQWKRSEKRWCHSKVREKKQKHFVMVLFWFRWRLVLCCSLLSWFCSVGDQQVASESDRSVNVCCCHIVLLVIVVWLYIAS